MASAAARDQAMKRSLMIYGIDIPDDMTGPEQRLDLDWYFFQVMQLPRPQLQLSDLVSPRWVARRKIQSLNMYADDNGVALIWPLLFFYLITCLTYCGSHGAPSYSVVAPKGL